MTYWIMKVDEQRATQLCDDDDPMLIMKDPMIPCQLHCVRVFVRRPADLRIVRFIGSGRLVRLDASILPIYGVIISCWNPIYLLCFGCRGLCRCVPGCECWVFFAVLIHLV